MNLFFMVQGRHMRRWLLLKSLGKDTRECGMVQDGQQVSSTAHYHSAYSLLFDYLARMLPQKEEPEGFGVWPSTLKLLAWA